MERWGDKTWEAGKYNILKALLRYTSILKDNSAVMVTPMQKRHEAAKAMVSVQGCMTKKRTH